ncbi:MAG TPA: BMP family ABC transporter substrate-binding protein [Ruminococcaceae bacterium]|nr:BMP family ABC transporter substrate-binding protein [Oscillospiraceae bacterium]HCT16754.1 BMP family ABC transporter substrate-binding protein [Oscillospiraceae bacterium]
MKKILAILMAIAMVFSFAACGTKKDGNDTEKKLKVGFIFLHDENSTYDNNFMTGAEEACKKMGVEILKKTNIPEQNACYDAAADLVDKGCSIVFADSFGHEDFMIKAAKEFPNVQFCHATGTKAHTEKLANFHNAFASIYEGRYLAGVAAGLKLNEMIAAGKFKAEDAKMGYVGAFTYAEVISGYTSFYLGAKSVCPTVTMDVQFTGSWYDEALEKEAATKLINNGCKLISQHADSMGAPTACETAGIPNVSYNGSTLSACPNTFIVSSRINWEPYFEYMIKCVQDGKAIDTDWTGTLQTSSVVLTDVNGKAAAKDTQAEMDKVKAQLEDGTLHVFDTNNFTVTVTADKNKNAKVDANGKLTSYMADVDTDANFTADTEVVKDGYFHESEFRSAPYFDVQIDGINLLNAKF